MCFLIKIIFGEDKKNLFILQIFLCQIEILVLNMLNLLKIPGFFIKISQILGFSRFFSLNCQILGFSRNFQFFWQPRIYILMKLNKILAFILQNMYFFLAIFNLHASI